MSELFIVGAQRSGTTYLYSVLDSHPQVLMAKPVRPEPKYFLKEDEWLKGRDYYESLYFHNRSKEHRYIGEKSTSYIEHKIVAERIKSYYPGAKILMILRDPVERAYSNYKFSVQHGIESLSFSDALSAESSRLSSASYDTSVNPYAYQQRGHYIKYIREYVSVFETSQIYIIIHEEFVSNIKAISRLYSWLDIDDTCVPDDYEKRMNTSDTPVQNDQKLLNSKLDLYIQFKDSINELEQYLGREIASWKR